MVRLPEVDALVFAARHDVLAVMTETGPDLTAQVGEAAVLAVLAVLVETVQADSTVVTRHQNLEKSVRISISSSLPHFSLLTTKYI